MGAVIAFALRRRVLMVLMLLFMFGVGIASFTVRHRWSEHSMGILPTRSHHELANPLR